MKKIYTLGLIAPILMSGSVPHVGLILIGLFLPQTIPILFKLFTIAAVVGGGLAGFFFVESKLFRMLILGGAL